MLEAVNEVLVEALTSEEPLAALQRAVDRAADRLSPGERAALLAVDRDGFLLTSLIVKKLRFERLLKGDPGLRNAFEEDPAGFTARFRRYDVQVPPGTFWPREEAEAFHAFEASAES